MALVFSGVSLQNSMHRGQQKQTDEGAGFCQTTAPVTLSISLKCIKELVNKFALEIRSDSSGSFCLYWLWPEEPSQPHLLYKSKCLNSILYTESIVKILATV